MVVLEVEAEPVGATIYIDRVELGARGDAPQKLGLAAGKYRVIARAPGFREAFVDLEPLAVGARKSVKLSLVPLLGKIKIGGTQVAGGTATARIDEVIKTCIAPCELEMPPGNAHVELSRPGFRTVETLVTVEPERSSAALFRMEPSTGVISVEADETGALIEIDGQASGYTPALLRVPVGKHTVRVSFPGAEPVERSMTISETNPQRLSAVMQRSDTVTAASRRAEKSSEAPSSGDVFAPHGPWLIGDNACAHRGQRIAVERRGPGEELKQDRAEGPNIRARIDLPRVADLLRRHVEWGADNCAGLSERDLFGRRRLSATL